VFRSGHSTQDWPDGTWSCADGFGCADDDADPADWQRWPWPTRERS
jgi:hypothetical protein